MIRTGIALILIIAAVLWLPLGVQIALFVAAIALCSYRLLFLIPAVLSDALYAPTVSITHGTMTLFVGVVLLAWFMLTTYTRLGDYYVSNQN